MTEKEWLGCDDPRAMVEFLRGKASERKLRLFAVACCYRIWHLLPDKDCREAVQIAESFADGRGDVQQLRSVEAAGECYCDNREEVREERLGYLAGGAIFQLGQEHLESQNVAEAAADTVTCSAWGVDPVAAEAAKRDEAIAQCQLLRDVFGNPFRPVTLDLAWRTSAVVALARGIYEERAFDRMPILADALEDAGCDNADVIAHCRDPKAMHVRGCWVVDLVLGKG
jgi:hypothetical protein